MNSPSDTTTAVRLTSFSHGAGCGCKIAPAVLQQIVQAAPQPFPGLLVGHESNDDAAVLDLGNGQALISTTDFFTPIVDDAFAFGAIASANALSDVYAMGGKPILALAILGWPVEKLAPELAQQVLAGARQICTEAGIPLAGGHSIDAPEPFFGLAVNGMVPVAQLKRNNTALADDLLLLTKPIGTGILSTAQKRERLAETDYLVLQQQLQQLNSVGALLAATEGVTAMTDVTGFGLLGHLVEMVSGSGLSAELYYNKIPVLEAARSLAQERIIPDATYRNWNSYNKYVQFAKDLPVMEAFNLLPDPQTNGGLLVAVRPQQLSAVQNVLTQHGYAAFTTPIGRCKPAGTPLIEVLP